MTSVPIAPHTTDGPNTAASQQHAQQQQQQTNIRRTPRRRTFAIGRFRFQCTRQRLLDAVLDGASWCLEGFVYVIGPLLIMLALSIVSLLVYTFFWILLPMMEQKHALNPLKPLILACHIGMVVFLIINVVFNYAACVLQRHTGPHYDAVVRELAVATDFVYPETPDQLAAYRRDFSDRMVLRLRRRQAARDAEEHAVAVAAGMATLSSGASHASTTATANATTATRRNPTVPTSLASPQLSTPVQPARPQPVIRSWMLMGPYEWGFCSNTNQPKPPRSHYDHVTRSLVLNLDHYCPWMFNAIGYFNYRYFVNVLIYAFVGMTYGTALLLEPFLLLKSREYHNQLALHRLAAKQGLTSVQRILPMMPLRDEKLVLTLSFMLCAAVGVAVGLLGGFHVYLACTAQTTIEFHGNWTARRRTKASPKWKNPYSHGSSWLNWQQVYGTGHFLWVIAFPSRRDPEFLPVPIPGASNRRNIKAAPIATSDMMRVESGSSDPDLGVPPDARTSTAEHFATTV